MRVGFGVTVLGDGLARGGVDGIGSYTRELLARFEADPALAIWPYSYSGRFPPGDAGHQLTVGRFDVQALCSLATGLPFPGAAALSRQVDLIHATDHFVPRVRGVPVVATFMDAIPLAHPEWVIYRFRAIKNALWRRTARWARRIVTISEHSRQEIAQHFRVPEERIEVVPLGVDRRWFVAPAPATLAGLRQRLALPEQYLLCVGTLQPRKNVARLLRAHRQLPPEVRRTWPLVVAGRAGWGCETEVAMLRDEAEAGRVRWLDYVADADMVPLMHGATALLFPSLHEGFGLPVLEAFAAGVPVLTSNTTSLPDVAGEAALLVDPLSEAELCGGMAALTGSPDLRARLIERGRARAGVFTWERTAAATRRVYEQVLAGGT